MFTKKIFSTLPIKKRTIEIDLLKGFVICLMIFTHTLHFFSNHSPISNSIILISQLTSFSCFVFSYGFACWKAYIDRDIFPRKKVFLTAIKIYTAFIISGLSYRLFIDKTLNFESTKKIIFLLDLPGFSEFLVFYFIITILILIFGWKIKSWMNSKNALLIVSILVLLSCSLPYNIDFTTFIGLLIRGQKYAYFPVLPHLPIFILGMYCAKKNIYPNRYLASISLIIVIVLLFLNSIGLLKFNRFPPNILWIVACVCFVNIVVYLVVRFYNFSKEKIILHKFYQKTCLIGNNALFYFLISNIIIFVLSNFIKFEKYPFIGSIMIWALIMFILNYFYIIQNQPKNFDLAPENIPATCNEKLL